MHVTRMACPLVRWIYAALLERLDDDVGRVLDLLHDLHMEKNTPTSTTIAPENTMWRPTIPMAGNGSKPSS